MKTPTINIKDFTPDQINDLKRQIEELENKPTPEERFLELLKGSIRKFDFDTYKDTVCFWEKDGKIIMEERKDGEVWIHYEKIWKVLESEYNYIYEEVSEFTKLVLERHFNLRVTKTVVCINLTC